MLQETPPLKRDKWGAQWVISVFYPRPSKCWELRSSTCLCTDGSQQPFLSPCWSYDLIINSGKRIPDGGELKLC